MLSIANLLKPGLALMFESTQIAQQLREKHSQMIGQVEEIMFTAREIESLSDDEREKSVRQHLRFLQEQFMPHSHTEETIIYPQWSQYSGQHVAAELLISEHYEIGRRIKLLEETDSQDKQNIQMLLFAIHTLILVHFRQEEISLLPDLTKSRLLDQSINSSLGEMNWLDE